MGVETAGSFGHAPDESSCRWIMAVHFVAESPGDNRRVVAVARNHLAQLFESVLHDFGRGLVGHAVERGRAPGRKFFLNQNAMAIAVVQHAFVLLPVHAGKNTVELFQVLVVVPDPLLGFRHAVLWIAARHALHAH